MHWTQLHVRAQFSAQLVLNRKYIFRQVTRLTRASFLVILQGVSRPTQTPAVAARRLAVVTTTHPGLAVTAG